MKSVQELSRQIGPNVLIVEGGRGLFEYYVSVLDLIRPEAISPMYIYVHVRVNCMYLRKYVYTYKYQCLCILIKTYY